MGWVYPNDLGSVVGNWIGAALLFAGVPYLVFGLPTLGLRTRVLERRRDGAGPVVSADPSGIDAMSDEDEKKCPMCAQMVKFEARICEFCRYEFTASDDAAAAQDEEAIQRRKAREEARR